MPQHEAQAATGRLGRLDDGAGASDAYVEPLFD
jgi:hypothetical protein